MLSHLIDFSIKNRWIVFGAILLMALGGVYSALRLPIDAVPDMTNTQVTVITDAGSLSPIEVERYVTYPIESTMGGLPKLQELRSVSRFGISVVTIVFEENTNLYWARQLVNERVVQASSMIPPGYGTPEIGPLATALGEILQFEVRGDGYSTTELRTILEWEIAPKLRSVHGVTEINTHGGYYKTFEIRPDPEKLAGTGITLDALFRAVEANSRIAAGGYIVHNDEQRFIRGQALLSGIDELERVVLRREPDGNPVLVQDVAEVTLSSLPRQGCVTRDGRGEAVTGMVMMLVGENSRRVVASAKERLKEIEPTLPAGVHIEVIYDRSHLIGRTLATVVTNLVEGGALVIIVLLIMLGSFRAGLITALAIPLSMLFATNVMYVLGISASLMSLGAIDFGLIVDSSVIMVENCMHRLAHATDFSKRVKIIRDAAIEVRKPTMFGELIIGVVYLPILMLQGTEGKLFRPMAMTVLFALAGSLVLSMTLMPALAAFALPRRPSTKDVVLLRLIKRVYEPLVFTAIRHPVFTALTAIALFGVSVPTARQLGAEFMPRLAEGDLLIEANRLPSSTLEDAIALSDQIEKRVMQFEEVKTVFCKTGRPEIANDVMGVHQTDVWVILKDHRQWKSGRNLEDLKKDIAADLYKHVHRSVFAITQPIEMRVDELVAGVKADVAVLLYGDDMSILGEKAKAIERVLKTVPGAADVKADYQANLKTRTIVPDRDALARYGIDADQVLNVVSAIGGHQVGTVFEGRARFPIMVRMPEKDRVSIDLMKQIPVAGEAGKLVPLGDLVKVIEEETPPGVEHEATRRRTYIAANVRGRDVATFVADAQRAVAEHVTLPTGYEIKWGGDFENLQSASLRLMIITPIVLGIIFLLLNASFGSSRLACLIFLAVPIAASGGIFGLALRGMPFSISAGVGFIALFGVAVLNGLVWVSAAEHLRVTGKPLAEITRETALARLRPVLMTALVAGLGFWPMAASTSDGAEIQRPLATVVIGGLVTSTLLTCFVLPAIYPWFAPKTHKIDPDSESESATVGPAH